MASGGKPWFLAFVLLFVFELQIHVDGEPQVPCYFIYGDSLADNGNNNAFLSLAKSNFAPYGEFLGFTNFIPPFATARDQDILRGVNYASGGGGIRAETGQNVGGRISFDLQLHNHGITVSRITALQRNLTFTREYLSKCIYTVGMGSNDYINNYFMPQSYPTSRLFTPDQYAAVLIRQYSQQLHKLYNYGARKVAIFGLGLIGCTPAELATFGTSGTACVDTINNAVQLFNGRLGPLVDDFNRNLGDTRFTYINITGISAGDPSSVGITFLNTPCCNVTTTTGLCIPNQAPCSNRNMYAFWDAFHPTEIINVLAATRAYNASSPSDAYPVDIRTLAELQ
ncbi:hypothetical protein RJ639_014612 [Escallonia herrerae]|uniref:Uncharacterized protein n=1 Tax=Escallonia herrerae TaxID=1293975 RepID=A0AA88VJP1_9ASTE|nr:hypothetical protein RJ639_014612 [Escallonia herrerae]